MATRAEIEAEIAELEKDLAYQKGKANSLKLSCNSTFGLLGSIYCPFFSPDLMLAVTITGQLFLLQTIVKIESIDGCRVISANTDGIETLIQRGTDIDYVFDTFEWEHDTYREIAYSNVNNYIAITTDGKVKRKGRFAPAGVMENGNPSFQICAEAAAKYLLDRTPVEDTVNNCQDIRQFVNVRNVTGGGVQHLYSRKVDDWVLEDDLGTAQNVWFSAQTGKRVKRKSRPAPLEVDAGGKPFGRVARWLRSTRNYYPLTYVSSGNKVPDTENAYLCLNLPETLPEHTDRSFYINRAKDLLASAGVTLKD